MSRARGRKAKAYYAVGLVLGQDAKRAVRVRDVPCCGAGERSGIKIGDNIIAVGRKKVSGVSGFGDLLGRQNTFVVRRSGRLLRVRLRAANIGDDEEAREWVEGLGSFHLGSRCNKAADCVDANWSNWCRVRYTYEGEGDHGGVLLKTHCFTTSTVIGPDGRPSRTTTETTAGPHEYF